MGRELIREVNLVNGETTNLSMKLTTAIFKNPPPPLQKKNAFNNNKEENNSCLICRNHYIPLRKTSENINLLLPYLASLKKKKLNNQKN